MRLLTCDLRGDAPGLADLVVKLQACELMHQMAGLAIDALDGTVLKRQEWNEDELVSSTDPKDLQE